ncbi:MAG: hypothetical protein IJ650_05805 [Paludibacteraceae bacterium]|nr:hypothetical protein [Paludibacteraceae bacterium]
MKKIYYLLFLLTLLVCSCKKDEAAYLTEVETFEVTSIYNGTAVSGGKISSGGEPTIKERGLEWCTTDSFSAGVQSVLDDKAMLGEFSCKMTDLEQRTTYYVRAYARNEYGTIYGQMVSFVTPTLPTVKTADIEYTDGLSFTSGGEVTDDGDSAVFARGICYDTDTMPTIDRSHTSDGKGKGKFISEVENLQYGTTYYVRAYAQNAAGIGYGETKTITTITIIPTIVTDPVTNVTASSANCGGNVTADGGSAVTERGVCYSTNQNPTTSDSKVTSGSGTGSFSCNLTGLTKGTTYYVRAYAINSKGISYGEQKSFSTTATIASVSTNSVTNITSTTATCGGNVTDEGGSAVTERGICYSTSQNPTTSDSKVTSGSGTGSFSCNLTGLTRGTTYYVRAYAINSKGIAYGEQKSFGTTATIASVSTNSVTNITSTTATCGGNVTDNGGATVTERGICYSTSQNPTTSDSKIASGSGTGSFSCNLTGLSADATYYVRAYATNNKGTAYGEQKSFATTSVTVPTVTTVSVSSVTTSTATCGGNVTSDGGAAVTERGVCYSKSQNPTISNSKVTSGSGTGSFSCNLTGLTKGITYYVRAYATNSKGTAYGEQNSFTTSSPEGAISGLFSVNATKQVYFSKGNLQYQASTGTWRFAEHQYDIIGEDNKNISDTYDGWIDLFGWGTGSNPTLSTTSYSDYGTFTNWGINKISNGGNTANQWRTMTSDEWDYLYSGRTNAANLRGQATVNNVHGYIFLPDNWSLPSGLSFTANANNWTTNTYSVADWTIMEQRGAVFLPAAGRRVGTGLSAVGSYGYYWSSTPDGTDYAYYLNFYSDYFSPQRSSFRFYGQSVRLVR